MKKLGLLFFSLLLILFGCAEQPATPSVTIEDLSRDLTNAIQKLIEGDLNQIKTYVKILSGDVINFQNDYLSQLKETLGELGKRVEYQGYRDAFETKAGTPVYSFDIGMKPDIVDKVYLLDLLFVDDAYQSKKIYTIPFITLKDEEDLRIYLSVIFIREDLTIIYPKPISM